MSAANRGRRWLVGVLAAIALVVAGVSACHVIFPWENDVLPKVLGPAKLIASEQESGFREGCSYAIFRLPDDVAQKIRDQGLAFLGDDIHPTWDDPRNPYSSWQKTPVPGLSPSGNPNIYAINAGGGCKNSPAVYTIDVQKIATLPGSYYLLTRNKEGMVLVIPDQRLAVYLYFG